MYQEPFVYQAIARQGLVRLGNLAERELRPRLDLVALWTVTQRLRKAPGNMVCANCGDGKHNILTCPKLKDSRDAAAADQGNEGMEISLARQPW